MEAERDDSEEIRTCRRRADSLYKQYLLADSPARDKCGGAVLGPEVAADGVTQGQSRVQGAQGAAQASYLIPGHPFTIFLLATDIGPEAQIFG